MPSPYQKFFYDYEPVNTDQDTEVLWDDFLFAGNKLDLHINRIYRIWHGINRRPAPELLERQYNGETLSRNEKLFLDTVTPEERAMYIAPGILSFKALESNFVSGHLSDMRNIGLISLRATRIVLEDVAENRIN